MINSLSNREKIRHGKGRRGGQPFPLYLGKGKQEGYPVLSRITKKGHAMDQATGPVSIWHNPQCSKSHQALKFLEENGITPR
ncbi:MAG: hypothetical protein H7839_18685 [Magnetococcus sp. YQC-5]